MLDRRRKGGELNRAVDVLQQMRDELVERQKLLEAKLEGLELAIQLIMGETDDRRDNDRSGTDRGI